MREPTRSEKILLSVFGLMILVFIGIVAWQTLQRSLLSHRQDQAILNEQLTELQRWQGEASMWETRAAWLQENPAPLWEQEQSEAVFVQELQQSFAANNLTILSQRLAGTVNLGDFQEVSVQMSLRGSTENIVRWLHQAQQPGEFLTVRQLTIRADTDKENLRAEITAVRHLSNTPAQAPTDLPSTDAEIPPQSPDAENALPPQPSAESPEAAEAAEAVEPSLASPTPLDPALPDSNPPADLPATLPRPSPLSPPTPSATPANPADSVESAPLPVLPFDDVFDPNSPSDDPVSVPAEEVFDLLPVPSP